MAIMLPRIPRLTLVVIVVNRIVVQLFVFPFVGMLGKGALVNLCAPVLRLLAFQRGPRPGVVHNVVKQSVRQFLLLQREVISDGLSVGLLLPVLYLPGLPRPDDGTILLTV